MQSDTGRKTLRVEIMPAHIYGDDMCRAHAGELASFPAQDGEVFGVGLNAFVTARSISLGRLFRAWHVCKRARRMIAPRLNSNPAVKASPVLAHFAPAFEGCTLDAINAALPLQHARAMSVLCGVDYDIVFLRGGLVALPERLTAHLSLAASMAGEPRVTEAIASSAITVMRSIYDSRHQELDFYQSATAFVKRRIEEDLKANANPSISPYFDGVEIELTSCSPG